MESGLEKQAYIGRQRATGKGVEVRDGCCTADLARRTAGPYFECDAQRIIQGLTKLDYILFFLSY